METSGILEALLKKTEWQTFDCKRALTKPAKLLETVVAFANSGGGIIALGLEDPEKAVDAKRLIGIKEGLDNVSEFLKLYQKEIDPLVSVKKYEIEIKNQNHEEDHILIISVDKSNDIHSLKNGDTFIRNGRQNTKIGSSEIIRLKYEKGVIKYENEITKIDDLDCIDKDLLEKFKTDTGSHTQDTWQSLKDNGLVLRNGEKYYLTKGGILLFGKNPAITLGSKCSIKISHYVGKRSLFTGEPNLAAKPISIEGPLYFQINKAVDYFRNLVRSSPPKLSGGTFKPTFLIPQWVFQEAIANAVIHRDYSIQNDIHVRFFDDRVEVESPGTYPGHVTVENIRQERFARNPLILRTLNRFSESPNLDHGEGVDRMFALMKAENLYEPIYIPPEVRRYSVLVMLLNLHRVEYWDTVSQYLDKNIFVTNRTAKKITGIADTLKMSKLLRKWTKQGLLQKTGEKKNTKYSKSVGVKTTLSLLSLGVDNKNET